MKTLRAVSDGRKWLLALMAGLALTTVFALTDRPLRASGGCCGDYDCETAFEIFCVNEEDCWGYTCCFGNCAT